jgi:putative salt-induced outer membrane protein YdiY
MWIVRLALGRPSTFGAIVTPLVNDVIMPPIGLILGHVDFKDLFISLNGQSCPTRAAAKASAAPTKESSMYRSNAGTPSQQPLLRNTFLSLGLIAACCATSAMADQIVMKNGDRVTGAVVKKDGKTITIKTDHFGVVTAAWDQVESVKIDAPVTVVLEDGKTVQGPVVSNNGQVAVAVPGAPVTVPPAQIAAIRNADEQKAFERLLNPGWAQLWAGAATIGFAGTSGNAKTLTFTTGVTAARVTRNDKTSIYFNTIKASALVAGRSSETAEAIRGGLAYDRNLGPRIFLNVFNDWEYDKFQNLDLRFVAGGGAGYHAWKRERSVLDLLGGIAYNHSEFSTPLTRNAAEAYWGDDYSWKLSGATSLVQKFRMFNNLTDTGGYRVNFDIGASTKIARWLTWNVSVSDRYLNRPAAGRKTNDLLYTTGLGITFAR